MDMDKIKRLGATMLGTLLIALNKKLGLDMSDEVCIALAGMIVSYVATSTWKAAKLAGDAAAATITDKASAIEAIKVATP